VNVPPTATVTPEFAVSPPVELIVNAFVAVAFCVIVNVPAPATVRLLKDELPGAIVLEPDPAAKMAVDVPAVNVAALVNDPSKPKFAYGNASDP
jgi:hypothetical protein